MRRRAEGIDPPLVELLEAMRDEHLRAAAALDIAIAAAGRASSLAPIGCDQRADGFTCSPQRWAHVCVRCGVLFQRCARHGGERDVLKALAAHEWTEHGIDDRTREAPER